MADKTEIEESLIDLVRQHPCLYLKTDDSYRNKNSKEGAWTLIGGILEKSAVECRTMWKSVRQQYMAFLKKLDHPTGTGASSRPHFRHESAMGFCREPTGNTSSFTNVTNADESHVSAEPMPLGDLLYEIELESEPTNAGQRTSPNVLKSTTRTHSKFHGKRRIDEVDEQLLKALKDGNNSDDEWSMFCASLAPKLRRLNEQNPGTATMAQYKILQLLHEIEAQGSQT